MADHIVFIKTSSLGDVVHNMPAVTDARRARPDAHIAWMVEEHYAALVALHPAVDEVIPVATRRWRKGVLRRANWREAGDLRRRLKARPPGMVIDTQGLLRTGLLARLTPGVRHGYDRQSIKEPLASFFYKVKHRVSRALHAIDRNRILTGLALGYPPDDGLDYGLGPLRADAAQPTAVLLHATAQAKKEWPEANWVALGCRLAAEGLRVLVPGGSEAERARAARIAGAVPGAEVPPSMALDEMTRLLGRATLVVGVDTGLLHIGAALAVPVVAVFGASDPALTAPRGAGPLRVLGSKDGAPDEATVTAAAMGMLAG